MLSNGLEIHDTEDFDPESTHYSLAFNHYELLHWARSAVENLREIENPTLIYTGLSGITAATAILLEYGPIPMVYVRKANEVSHGQRFEHSDSICTDEISHAVFVDDVIDSGKTLFNVLNAGLKIKKLTVLLQQEPLSFRYVKENLDFADMLEDLSFDIDRDCYYP